MCEKYNFWLVVARYNLFGARELSNKVKKLVFVCYTFVKGVDNQNYTF